MQPVQMSQVHFEEDAPAFAETFNDMYMSSQAEGEEEVGQTRKRSEDVEMNSHDEAPDTTEMENNVSSFPPFQRDRSEDSQDEDSQDEDTDMSTDEEVVTGGKKNENKASSSSAFSSI